VARVKALHERDRKRGYGSVHMPFALARKYPRAEFDWKWQYVTHVLNKGGKGVRSPLDRD
jgi:hypothetical protein